MRKLKLIAVFTVLAFSANAQNSYGEYLYNHPNSILSCGFPITSAQSGFMMAGFVPDNSATYNFCIDRTDTCGNISSGAGFIFQRRYTVNVGTGATCGFPLNPLTNCHGVSVIETTFTGSPFPRYALTGAYDNGCFLTFLDNSGVPILSRLFPFPVSTVSGSVKKPLILETANNEFLIVGGYNNLMYVIRVDVTGAIVWSQNYDIQGVPKAILMSPYTAGALVVVGNTIPPNGDQDGFFMEIDETNGTILNATLYDMSAGGTHEGFSSISVSSNNSPSTGFIVGGYHYPSGGGGPINGWVIKLNQNGTSSVGLINELLIPSTDINAGDIMGIVERYSFALSSYEYYATLSSSSGIIVLKLDLNGIPAGGAGDEFVFNGNGTLPNSRANAISFYNTSAPFDEGLHIFGSDDVNNPDNHYLMKAYFSGESGCSGSNSASSLGLTTNANTFPVNTNSGLNVCTGISINNSLVSNITALCGPGTVPGGSNAKGIMAGGENNRILNFTISPNPSAGFFTVDAGEVRISSIHILDFTGKLVYFSDKLNETGPINIDLREMDLEAGLYTILIQDTLNEKTTKKIVFQP